MNRLNLAVCALALPLIITAVGCEQKGSSQSGAGAVTDQLKQAAGEAGKSVTDAANKLKDDAVASVTKMVDDAKPKIDQLKEKGSALAGPMKEQFDAAFKDIDTHYNTARSKLAELKTAGADQWKKLAEEATTAASSLTSSLKSAYDKFMVPAAAPTGG